MFTPSAAFISFQMPEFKSVGGGQDVSHSKLRYRWQQRSVLLFGFDSTLCRFKLYVLLIKMISFTYIHPNKSILQTYFMSVHTQRLYVRIPLRICA
jgi:hypothetical protein